MSSRQGIDQYERDKTWVRAGSSLEPSHRAHLAEMSAPAAPRTPQRWFAVKGVRRPRAPGPLGPAALDPVGLDPLGADPLGADRLGVDRLGVGATGAAPPNPDWASASEAGARWARETVLESAPQAQPRAWAEIVVEPVAVRAARVVELSRPLPWTTRALRIVITKSNGRRRFALDVLQRLPPAALQRTV